jgi:hypothetical protein
MRAHLARLPLLLALGGGGLQAGDLTWGLQVGMVALQGDVKDHAYLGTHKGLGGAALELRLEWAVSPRDAVRFRFGSMGSGTGRENLVEVDPDLGPVTLSTEWHSRELGVDWRRQWSAGTGGWYTVAGLGLAHAELDASFRAEPWPGEPRVGHTLHYQQDNRLALHLGGGYQFTRHFNVELGYHQVAVDKDGADGFGISALKWVELGVGVTFGRRR